MSIRKFVDKTLIVLIIICLLVIAFSYIPKSDNNIAYASGEIDDSYLGSVQAAILILRLFHNYESMAPEGEMYYSYTYGNKQKLLFAEKKKSRSTEVLRTFSSKVYNNSTNSLNVTGKTTSTLASMRSDICISTGINNSTFSNIPYEVKEELEGYFDRKITTTQYQNTTFNLPVDGSLPYGTYAVRDVGIGYLCKYIIVSLETLYDINNQPYLAWVLDSQYDCFEVEKSYYCWEKIN